jgi:hypothetical protein
MKVLFGFPGIAVKMDLFAPFPGNKDLFSLHDLDVPGLVKLFQKEGRCKQQKLEEGDLPDDAEVDEAVVEFCYRIDAGIAAELV